MGAHGPAAGGRPAAGGPAKAAGRPLHVGVVHAAGEVCHVCVADSAAALDRKLGLWVGEHAWYQLEPQDAARVQALLRGGRHEEAVRLYFERVGARWDPERLDVRRVEGVLR